jgi:hypothetical protein
MRNVLTTFVGVLLALLVFVGIRHVVRQDRQQQQKIETVNAEYNELQRRENAARESLKTADARLWPLNNDEDFLWPPALENHDKWTWAKLRQACGKPVHGNVDVGDLDYRDASGNLVQFLFGPDGVSVTVSYADPKHVTNPDLIGSINSIPCLAAMR